MDGGLMAALITIRAATLLDLDALHAIEIAAFDHDRLSRRSLHYAIGSPAAYLAVAEIAGEVAGYALANFRKGSRSARIFSLAKKAGVQGVGRPLIVACAAEARVRGCTRMTLEVRPDNASAIALYDRLGFSVFGRHTEYYEDGADALRFAKSLTDNTIKEL